MMKWGFILGLGLAACGFGAGSNNKPNGMDPDAGQTVDAAPDAAIDALPVDRDPDRDGVLDPDDNCPSVANPLQANDDSDQRGDACDTCPWKANEARQDLDNDNLTDDCDPDPRYADQLTYFQGFDKLATDQQLPQGWVARTISGTWTVSTSAGTMTGAHPAAALQSPAIIAIDLGAGAFGERLYVRSVAQLTDGGNDHRQAGIIGDIDLASVNGPAGALCEITLDQGKSVAGFFRATDTAEEGNSIGSMAGPVSMRLTVERRAAGTVQCDARGTAAGSATRADDTAARQGTGVGFRVSNGTAAFQYIAVIRLNPLSKPPSF